MILFNGFQTGDGWARSELFNNYGTDGVKGFVARNLGGTNKASWRVVGTSDGMEFVVVPEMKLDPSESDIASDDKPWDGYYIDAKSAVPGKPTTIEAWAIGPNER